MGNKAENETPKEEEQTDIELRETSIMRPSTGFVFDSQSPKTKIPFTSEEDCEILKIVNASHQPVGGEKLWKKEANDNQVSFFLLHSKQPLFNLISLKKVHFAGVC